MNTLRLALRPLVPGELLAYAPPHVDYELGDLKAERRASGDFRPTNRYLNEIQLPLLEATLYDGVAMWQFLPSYLWPAFHRTLELIELVDGLVEEHRPEVIVAAPAGDDADPYWRGVLEAVAAARGLRLELEGFAAPAPPPRVSESVVRGAIRRVRTRRRRVRRRSVAAEGRTLALVTLGERHWVDGRDEQFGPLLPALRDAGWQRFIFLDTQSVAQSALQARGEADAEWRSFASYLPEHAASSVPFMRMWDAVAASGVLRHRGIDLLPALGNDLASAFARTLPHTHDLLVAARRFLQSETPRALIATYETGPWARALVIESAFAGVPTIGLQHGMIFDNHYDYMHARITPDPAAQRFGFAVPRVTCVWGEHWRAVLTEAGHYPERATALTGNWRYAGVDVRAGRREQDVVGVFTGSQSPARFVTAALRAVEAVGARAVVRLHATDDRPDIRELVERLGATVADGTLASTLGQSGTAIVQVSTVVAEAGLFDLPIVLADLEGTGADAYAETGICVVANDERSIEDALRRLQQDESLREQLAAARARFVNAWFDLDDGDPRTRVASVVQAACGDGAS